MRVPWAQQIANIPWICKSIFLLKHEILKLKFIECDCPYKHVYSIVWGIEKSMLIVEVYREKQGIILKKKWMLTNSLSIIIHNRIPGKITHNQTWCGQQFGVNLCMGGRSSSDREVSYKLLCQHNITHATEHAPFSKQEGYSTARESQNSVSLSSWDGHVRFDWAITCCPHGGGMQARRQCLYLF